MSWYRSVFHYSSSKLHTVNCLRFYILSHSLEPTVGLHTTCNLFSVERFHAVALLVKQALRPA